jgi:uncharacterized glyoxalase superfamily protein PhnB
MLSYEDVGAAADWLCRAFGFRQRGERVSMPNGTVTHVELELDGAMVMLGWPGPAYRGPARHAERCEVERAMHDNPFVVDGVLVHVDDVDAHHAAARDGGATILREPTDESPGRLYVAGDLEGHRWMFLQASG